MYDGWFKEHVPQSSLIICTPYIKQGAVDHLWEDFNLENNVSNIELKVLIRGNTEEFTSNRSSDITVLHMFHKIGIDNVEFNRICNLHMKAYLVDNSHLLITSGNLTNSGMFVVSGKENFEGGIATDDKAVIKKFLDYFNHIWCQSEPLSVFYDQTVEDYNKYISAVRGKVLPQKRKRRYQFPKSASSTKTKYALSEFPSAKLDTLLWTLNILTECTECLSRYDLGMELRKRYENATDLDNVTNNTKYGEEKGNLAVYFGLATQYKQNNLIVYSLNENGKRYLQSEQVERFSYLLDQIQHKEAICDIIEQSHNKGFNLKSYLYEICDGKHSTLDRKVAPIKSLLSLTTPEGLKIEL